MQDRSFRSRFHQWHPLPGHADLPPRAGHTATVAGTKIFVMGGRHGETFLNDVWAFDMEWERWELVQAVAPFSPRAYHSATLVGGREIWLLGGSDNARILGGVHVLDIQTLQWRRPLIEGQLAATPRGTHSALVHPQKPKSILIFGGFGGGNAEPRWLADLSILHTDSLAWEEVQPSGNAPCARGYHTMTAVDQLLILFGGKSSSGIIRKSNISVYDCEHNTWRDAAVQGAAPLPRSNHVAASVASEGSRLADAVVVINGGRNGAERLADTWQLQVNSCGTRGNPASLVVMTWHNLDPKSRKSMPAGCNGPRVEPACGDRSHDSGPAVDEGPSGRTAGGGDPGGRAAHALAASKRSLYILGGYGGKGVTYGDIFVLRNLPSIPQSEERVLPRLPKTAPAVTLTGEKRTRLVRQPGSAICHESDGWCNTKQLRLEAVRPPPPRRSTTTTPRHKGGVKLATPVGKDAADTGGGQPKKGGDIVALCEDVMVLGGNVVAPHLRDEVRVTPDGRLPAGSAREEVAEIAGCDMNLGGSPNRELPDGGEPIVRSRINVIGGQQVAGAHCSEAERRHPLHRGQVVSFERTGVGGQVVAEVATEGAHFRHLAAELERRVACLEAATLDKDTSHAHVASPCNPSFTPNRQETMEGEVCRVSGDANVLTSAIQGKGRTGGDAEVKKTVADVEAQQRCIQSQLASAEGRLRASEDAVTKLTADHQALRGEIHQRGEAMGALSLQNVDLLKALEKAERALAVSSSGQQDLRSQVAHLQEVAARQKEDCANEVSIARQALEAEISVRAQEALEKRQLVEQFQRQLFVAQELANTREEALGSLRKQLDEELATTDMFRREISSLQKALAKVARERDEHITEEEALKRSQDRLREELAEVTRTAKMAEADAGVLRGLVEEGKRREMEMQISLKEVHDEQTRLRKDNVALRDMLREEERANEQLEIAARAIREHADRLQLRASRPLLPRPELP